jgi:hypothetical protein
MFMLNIMKTDFLPHPLCKIGSFHSEKCIKILWGVISHAKVWLKTNILKAYFGSATIVFNPTDSPRGFFYVVTFLFM